MRLIADLHFHSKYSRACSDQLTLEQNTQWANWKGLDLLGTADFTHPFWLHELGESLVEVGEGVYRYQNEKGQVYHRPLYFLTVETSHIFTHESRGRRVHLLVWAPSIEVVEKINSDLARRGVNLMSDGRPMTGLSCQNLADLIFSISEDCLIIPAHAWTPWYGIFGDKGGFDSLEEAFGEYADQIYAIETGLSSDPAMNWRTKELDSRSVVSFSDAHSPWKLGREATVFEIASRIPLKSEGEDEEEVNLSYQDIVDAIKQKPNSHCRIHSTIEFYPEEGKYHYTGHRNCNVRQSPEQTAKLGTTCPVCRQKLTVGVMHRVEELAVRTAEELEIEEVEGLVRSKVLPDRPGYRMLVPLTEILAETFQVGVNTKAVLQPYHQLVSHFGSEFEILLNADVDEIKRIVGDKVGTGVEKVRQGDLLIEPGFDGVFGKVMIWGDKQEPSVGPQQESLFDI